MSLVTETLTSYILCLDIYSILQHVLAVYFSHLVVIPVHKNSERVRPLPFYCFTQFIYIWKLLYMFRVVPPPSSGEQTTISTASGICHTVTAICRYRGRVGTGLSVLWVVYATYSTLKPVPTLPR